MSPSVARSVLNLQILSIEACQSMEEVITEEEQLVQEMTTKPLFPRLEKLVLEELPKLGHFFLTKHALEFTFLGEVRINSCPEMKTFSLGSVSTHSLDRLIVDYAEVKDNLNKAIQQLFILKVCLVRHPITNYICLNSHALSHTSSGALFPF